MEQTGESSQSIRNRKVINLSLTEVYNPPDENLPIQDLYTKDFSEDLILTSGKKYILRENIISNEKKVLTIQGEKIILDLNSYTLHAAVNHSIYEARAVVEVLDSKDIVIRNGTLKGYTDYGIFTCRCENIHLYDVKLLDWSVTAINVSQINGLHGARNILMPSNGNMLHKDIYISAHKTLKALKLFNFEDSSMDDSSNLEDLQSSSDDSSDYIDGSSDKKESFHLEDDNLETLDDGLVTVNDSDDSSEDMEIILRKMRNIKNGMDEDEETVEDIINKINKIKNTIKVVDERPPAVQSTVQLPPIDYYADRLEKFMQQNEEALDGPSLYLDKTLYGINIEKSSNISLQKTNITNLNKMSNTYDYISVNNQIVDAEPYGSYGLLRWKDVYAEDGTFSPNPFIQAQCCLIYYREHISILENRDKIKSLAFSLLTKDEGLFNSVAKRSINHKNKGIIGVHVADSEHVILNKVVIKNAKNRGVRKVNGYLGNDIEGFKISAVNDIRMINCEVSKCSSINGSYRGYSFDRKLTTGQIFKCLSSYNEIKAEDNICCSFFCSHLVQLDMFKCTSEFLSSPRMTAGIMLQQSENVLCRKCTLTNHEANSTIENFTIPETKIATDGKKSFGILMENTTNCLLSKNNIKDISIIGDSGFSSSMAIGVGALNDHNSIVEDCSIAYINSDQGRSVSILLLGNSTTRIKNNICAWNSPQGFGIIDKSMGTDGIIIGNMLFGHSHENIITRRKIQNKLITVESPSTKGLFKTDKNYILVPEEKDNFEQLSIDNKKDRWIINCGKQEITNQRKEHGQRKVQPIVQESTPRKHKSRQESTHRKHRDGPVDSSTHKHQESPRRHKKHRQSEEKSSFHGEEVTEEEATKEETAGETTQTNEEVTEEYTPKKHRRQTSMGKDLDDILKDLPKGEKKKSSHHHHHQQSSHSHYRKKHPGMKNVKSLEDGKSTRDDKPTREDKPTRDDKSLKEDKPAKKGTKPGIIKLQLDDSTTEDTASPIRDKPKTNIFEDNFGIENSYDVPSKSKKVPDNVEPPKPPTPKSTGFMHIN
jgi:hypothetical protein